jgi:hypothetical protein
MNPQFLFFLVSSLALLVQLKGRHNACTKLTIKLGGHGPKFVQVKTPPSNITSLLVEKILVHHWGTLTEAKVDKDFLVVIKRTNVFLRKRSLLVGHRSLQQAMVDESVKQNQSITYQANMWLGFPMDLKCTPRPSEDALMSNIDKSKSKDLFASTV